MQHLSPKDTTTPPTASQQSRKATEMNPIAVLRSMLPHYLEAKARLEILENTRTPKEQSMPNDFFSDGANVEQAYVFIRDYRNKIACEGLDIHYATEVVAAYENLIKLYFCFGIADMGVTMHVPYLNGTYAITVDKKGQVLMKHYTAQPRQ